MPIRRTIKNVVRNYSDSQIKVREATSNDPWGPSSTLMSEIADLTYNVVAFTEIMQMVWKRLNDHGKNWRHVYKALVLLDYLVKTGSEKVAQQCKENIFAIQTLKDFQYIEENKDQGINVREKAKMLVMLLKDDERLKAERTKALKAKERFAQNAMGFGSNTPPGQVGSSTTSPTMSGNAGQMTHSLSNSEMESVRPQTANEEELQLQIALAMSKEEHEEDLRKQRGDDVKLQMALEESRKEVPQEDGGASGGASALLDLAGPTSTDPWGMPISQQPPPAQSAVSSDPWVAPQPTIPPPAAVTPSDPWSPATTPAKTATPGVTPDTWGSSPTSGSATSTPSQSAPLAAPPPDPWAPPPNNTGASNQTSPWGSPAQQPAATNGGATIDDAFDMLSSRTNQTPGGPSASNGTDLLSGGASSSQTLQPNPFDLSGMGQALTPEMEAAKKKSAEDFLGDNANLVNLDNLVTKPATVPEPVLNPFGVLTNTNNAASTTPQPANPFGTQQQSRGVPMNQMANPAITGFSQSPAGVTTVPTQMVPTGNPWMTAAQPPVQSNNPFL